MTTFALILPAAGTSSRFGGGRSKLLEDLEGRSVLARSLDAFGMRSDVARIIVAVRDDQVRQAAERWAEDSGRAIVLCEGAESRQETVRCALAHVPPEIEWLAIHDAARPLISRELIDRTLAAAMRHGAAVPAVAVTPTIKQAQGPLPAPVQRTVSRHDLWGMQTPQIMRRADLENAFDRCPLPLGQVTDDAQLLELAGLPVWLVPGEQRNLKITSPADLLIARTMWAAFGNMPN